MEIAVKWVYQEVKHNGVTMEAGQKPALCFRARKYMLCVAAGYPVRVLKRAVKDFDKARQVMHGAAEHTVARAVQQFEQIAAHNGITEAARKLLQKARDGQNGIDENEFQDEEGVTTMMRETETPVPTAEGAAEPETTTTEQETTAMAKTKKAKKAPKAKAAKKVKAAKGPSRISRAVEYMREEVRKEGGQKNLERGWRKELFERSAKKFDLSPVTCSIQYGKQILNKSK